MATIHLIDGGIGSVGKSLFCRVLIQYCLDHHLPYHFVESDINNPDVAQIYPSHVEINEKNGESQLYCTQVSFEQPDRPGYSPNLIFDLALQQPVIVNLPAHAFTPVNLWIEGTEALKLSSGYGIHFCKWFLTNGRQDSLERFRQSLQHLGSQVRHVLVLNHYFRQNWSGVFEPVLLQLVNQYHVGIVGLPKLADKERDWIEVHRLPFNQACRAQTLTIFEKQRIHTFLKTTYQSIQHTNLLNSP
jgi:hypothetical protein